MAATAGAAFVTQWASELADLSEHVMEKIPVGEDWQALRHFLRDITSALRRGNVRAGARAFYKVLPYVQRIVSGVEKCTNIKCSYDVTETISQHFLVDESARKHLEKLMSEIKKKAAEVKVKVEAFADKMDTLLDDVIGNGKEVGTLQLCKLAFQMNRINSMIDSCEKRLADARCMLDALDNHVATKSLLATIFSLVFLAVGIVFSAAGRVQVGAACVTAATASRASAKSLNTYHKKLSEIDHEHRDLQAELDEWRMRFQAEQRNFLWLLGYHKILLIVTVFAFVFLLVGQKVNACALLMFLYLSVFTSNGKFLVNSTSLLMAVVAIVMEYKGHHGLVAYNTLSALLQITKLMGFINPLR